MQILIVKLSAMGDIFMSTRLLNALRHQYPHAHITWLVDHRFAHTLAGHRDINRLLVLKRKGIRFVEKLKSGIELWQTLRSYQYDLVIDAQGLLKSALWAKLARTKRRVALNCKEGSQYLFKERVMTRNDDPMLGSEYIALAAYLGLPNTHLEMNLDIARFDSEAVFARFSQSAKSYLAICPFTTRPQKHWHLEGWQTLCAGLSARYNKPIMVLGGPQDKIASTAFAAIPNTVNLVGQTSIAEALVLIKHAALVVGVDTGLTHAATAAKVPTVAIFTSTKPYLHTDSAHTVVIDAKLPCSPCRRNPTCHGRFDCIPAISAASVLEHIPKDSTT